MLPRSIVQARVQAHESRAGNHCGGGLRLPAGAPLAISQAKVALKSWPLETSPVATPIRTRRPLNKELPAASCTQSRPRAGEAPEKPIEAWRHGCRTSQPPALQCPVTPSSSAAGAGASPRSGWTHLWEHELEKLAAIVFPPVYATRALHVSAGCESHSKVRRADPERGADGAHPQLVLAQGACRRPQQPAYTQLPLRSPRAPSPRPLSFAPGPAHRPPRQGHAHSIGGWCSEPTEGRTRKYATGPAAPWRLAAVARAVQLREVRSSSPSAPSVRRPLVRGCWCGGG